MNFEQLDPTDWREWRRMRAWRLKQLRWKQRDIAAALGVSTAAVSQWLAQARSDGPAALLSHPAPGHPAKLEPAQLRLTPDFLSHGAEAYGFRGEVWTCARVNLSRVGKGRPAGSIELRVSPSPSKIPYGGFSPVRLQMDRQWRPSTTSRGLSAVHIRPMTPSYTPPQFSLPGIRDPQRDYPF